MNMEELVVVVLLLLLLVRMLEMFGPKRSGCEIKFSEKKFSKFSTNKLWLSRWYGSPSYPSEISETSELLVLLLLLFDSEYNSLGKLFVAVLSTIMGRISLIFS